ncbi:hypothetical protein K438DRAFT_562534 [Mycena galopus ATCC 62051]|nr:hypothetical protein K438DRAFT_562534 [Mycena galopus ATCC 62051]
MHRSRSQAFIKFWMRLRFLPLPGCPPNPSPHFQPCQVLGGTPTNLPGTWPKACKARHLPSVCCRLGIFPPRWELSPGCSSSTAHRRPLQTLSRPLGRCILVGITLSASPTLKMHEKTFLARALSALPSSLSGLHPRKALHALQAEIVLATYFFSAGKFVECLYHTAAAVSLAVSSGLHKTFAEAPGMLSGAHATDSEESERFNACLAILTLDKAWAVALGTPSNWNDTLLAPGSLETGYGGDGANDISPKTLLANAVVLWERANSLAVRWDPEMSVQDSHEFFSKFSILDERIDNFRRAVTTFSAESLDARALVVVYSIAHTATIQLHAPFKNNEVSHRKTVDAATAVLIAAADTANLVDCVFINPIVVCGPLRVASSSKRYAWGVAMAS